MYIFGRSRRMNPAQGRAPVQFAIEAASRASDIIGMPVWAWSEVMSEHVGTLYWTTRAEHLEDLITADDALGADDQFSDWVAQNDNLFTGPLADVVSEVLHNPPTTPPAAYVEVAQGVAAHGAVGEALGLAVEIAETATRLSNLPTMVATPLHGPFGGIGWLTSVPDLGALEAGNAALAGNDEWIKLIDRAGHAFQPGIRTSLLRRLT